MSEPATLAVIIPVYGAPPELTEQLAALAAQRTRRPFDVVIAHNGGEDVRALLRRQSALPARLRIVDATERPGQAAAINCGARATDAEAFLLLDADDVVADDYVDTMWRALDSRGFVAARLDCDTLNPGWLKRSRPATQTDGVGTPFGFLPSAAGCSIGVRRVGFELVGGFDERLRLGNDVDFSWRLQLAGIPVHFVGDAIVQYRYRPGLRSTFRQARAYGVAGPALFSRYRDLGMPRRSWRSALRFHLAAVYRLGSARSRGDLAEAAFLIGFRVGILEGASRHRVMYL